MMSNCLQHHPACIFLSAALIFIRRRRESMDNKDTKKEKPVKDIELPSLDSQIESWCEITEDGSGTKSAGDLEINAWCQGSQNTVPNKRKDKK